MYSVTETAVGVWKGQTHLVDWQTDGVDEADLHGGQLVLLLSVHDVDGLDLERLLLEVALLEELAVDHLGHLLLQRPRFGDGAHVARRHHHRTQQLAVLALAPVRRRRLDEFEELEAMSEIREQSQL